MIKIGFIGAYDKIDMLTYVAKILTVCEKKVLVVDSTINQKARYVIPAINPSSAYITDFEDIDFAVGFTNLGQIKQYLGITDELPYDIILIDIDNPYNIAGFELNQTEKNYFVTGFDLFTIKRGMQIISLIHNPVKLSKILYSRYMTKEENEYLEYLALGYKVQWDDNNIYFPINVDDQVIIAENQRGSRINLKKMSQDYKYALIALASELSPDINENNVKRAIRIIEGGKNG